MLSMCLLHGILMLLPWVSSAGIDVLTPSFALCLYRSQYFDFVLEIDNPHMPYWKQHVAGALLVRSIPDTISHLGDCKDRKMLVVSPEGCLPKMPPHPSPLHRHSPCGQASTPSTQPPRWPKRALPACTSSRKGSPAGTTREAPSPTARAASRRAPHAPRRRRPPTPPAPPPAPSSRRQDFSFDSHCSSAR